MVTAMLTVPFKRKSKSLFDQPFARIVSRFQSKVTIRCGNSEPFDISSVEQLRELALRQNSHFVIVAEGRDEMKTVSTLIDYINHGLGI